MFLLHRGEVLGFNQGRNDKMRDQLDAEIWNTHHDQLSKSIDHATAAAGAWLRRGADRVPVQLVAILFAATLTLATFGASAA